MNLYYLQGYRPFKSEKQIKEIVLDYMQQKNFDDSSDTHSKEILKLHALKIFQTSKQQTWVVTGYGYIFCLLDDIQVDIEKDFELIKWYTKSDDIKDKITIQPLSQYSNKFGLIDFGDSHKNWYYSKSLLNDEKMAINFIKGLVVSGSSSS